MPEDEFWILSPKQVKRFLNACRNRRKRERVYLKAVAWWTANLSRAKNMPSMESFIKDGAESEQRYKTEKKDSLMQDYFAIKEQIAQRENQLSSD